MQNIGNPLVSIFPIEFLATKLSIGKNYTLFLFISIEFCLTTHFLMGVKI